MAGYGVIESRMLWINCLDRILKKGRLTPPQAWTEALNDSTLDVLPMSLSPDPVFFCTDYIA